MPESEKVRSHILPEDRDFSFRLDDISLGVNDKLPLSANFSTDSLSSHHNRKNQYKKAFLSNTQRKLCRQDLIFSCRHQHHNSEILLGVISRELPVIVKRESMYLTQVATLGN